MSHKNKKLVMVSTVIHGVRRTSFLSVEPSADGRIHVPQEKMPGTSTLERGTTVTVGG